MPTTKYPKEIFSVVRRNKTLSVTSELYPADAYNNEKPLETYGKFSRFPVTIINTQNNPKKILTANIDIDLVPDMLFRTKFTYRRELEESITPVPVVAAASNSTQVQGNSPGMTTVLSVGNYKGMTPVQVILKEGGTAGLERQRNFLAQKAAQYPANNVQIAAINDAINLYMSGQLTNMNIQESVPSGNAGQKLVLYSADLRPNIYKTRSDGMSLVTSFHVYWIFGNKYPVELAIDTYYAPVQKLQDGRLNVLVNNMDKTSEKKENILLSAVEWMDMCARIHRNMKQFEIVHAKKLFNDAETIAVQNREAAKNTSVNTASAYNPIPDMAVNNMSSYPSQTVSGSYQAFTGVVGVNTGFGYQ